MTRRLILSFLALASGLFAQEAKPSQAYAKVLFLGNSITKHGPKADLDWHGNWGMAATAEAKDYVHLVTAGLTDKQGKAPEVSVNNIADFERNHVGYDVGGKLAANLDFKADLIILAIGENVPALKSDESKAAFKTALTDLLKHLKGPQNPTIIVRSCFWANAAKDEVLKQCAAEAGATFVDISALSKDESNYGRAERPYKHAGVANHPGDKGMQGIAEAILKAVK
ncbi:Lysophospholipase L1 [Prosthecobacter debontii]|uniref:Lysophospholipase L1 n=1 Tax=Prosthecobacter debontii TaxID=48467 RepID=A0A1T4Z179_9BACT|nr:hypothetical protein [Prosthecobacter debontii]SKB07653.1 Lysophospholipase L1 [Prosthecobacter debontii]